MKKLLLFSVALIGFSAQAQFWTEKAIGVTTANRGVDNISIVDENVVWVKTYDGSGAASQTVKDISRSIDGGETWTPATFGGIGTGTLGMGNLHAISATTAWIAAFPTGAQAGGIYKTTNGGSTWVKQTTALFNQAESFANLVYFWDANNGVAQGDPQGGYFEIYTTTNGGTTWVRVPSANIPTPLAGEYGYTNNYDVVNNTMWFGTNMGRLFKSTDQGMTWEVNTSPVTDFGSATMSASYSFSDEMKGIMNTSAGMNYITNDGAETWTPIAGSGLFFNDIEYIPGTSKVVATGLPTLSYGTYYSYDDGVTWMEGETATQTTELEFLSETVGYGGGFVTNATDGGIYKYTGTQLGTGNFTALRQISASPNPTNGMLQLVNQTTSINNVVVYDLLGKQVFSSAYGSLNEVNVDLTNLQTGAYILRATNDVGGVETIKILKN
ncbi:MAG TPA: T9SS type A sorting domain-containing protein [Flavobacterium sp.]|nr:T9SS type A sorting domain-containing protein [Flavobacterium sp.]